MPWIPHRGAMSAQRRTSILALLALLSLTSACDVVERVRNRSAPADTVAAVATGGGLMLGLQTPGALRPGEEGLVRLSVTNRGDTVASRIRLELIVPGWIEPLPPRPGEREVSMAAMEDGGTRFAYRMDDTPLDPNQSQTVEQRIRVPAAGPLADRTVPWSRVVQARLLGPDGQPLAEVESEIALEGVADPDTVRGAAMADPSGRREQLGPVQLGMTGAALRRAVPAARDTAWAQGGAPQRGLVVPFGTGGGALAALSGDSVVRIEVRDPAVRTRERVGIGSRVEELRAAYGPACADVADGGVVVWFANAPGLTFALDTPVPESPAQLRASPERVPGSARVTGWWLSRGADRCPA
jgi:hypothetical protein